MPQEARLWRVDIVLGPILWLSFYFLPPQVSTALLWCNLPWWCTASWQTQKHGAMFPWTETIIHNKPFFPIVLSYFDRVMKCARMYNTIHVIITLFWLWYEGIEEGEVNFVRWHTEGIQLVCFSLKVIFWPCVLCSTPQRAMSSSLLHSMKGTIHNFLGKEPHYPEHLGFRCCIRHTCFSSSLVPTFAWQQPWGICLCTLLIGLHFMDVGALVSSYLLYNPGHFSLIDSLALHPHVAMPRSSLWKCQDCFPFFSESCLVLKLIVKAYPGLRLLI